MKVALEQITGLDVWVGKDVWVGLGEALPSVGACLMVQRILQWVMRVWWTHRLL